MSNNNTSNRFFFIVIFLLTFNVIGWGQSTPNGVIDDINELVQMDTVYIPMNDGTLLATSIALPVFQDSVTTNITIGENSYPIKIIPIGAQYIVSDSTDITPKSYELPMIFSRTPYNRIGSDEIVFFPFLGYTFAIQDMRGRYESEGVYFPMYSDSWEKAIYHPSITIPMDVTPSNDPSNAINHHDGSQSVYYLADSLFRIADVNLDGIMDTINYTNGQMGMFGASALGNSQYQALSDMPFTESNPLKCIVPIVATNEHYNTTLFHNGVYRNSLVNGWITGQMMDINDSLNATDNSIHNNIHSSTDYGYTDKVEITNDLIDWFVSDKFTDSPSGAYPNSLLRKDLDASMAPLNNQGHSDANGTVSRYENLNIPAYHLTGWWDIFINGQIETFNNTRKSHPLLRQRLVIGPWAHQTIGKQETGDMIYPENVTDLLKIDLDIDPESVLNDSTVINKLYNSEIISWYRAHLGGEPYFIIAESEEWQSIGTSQIRVPSNDYVIPYYQFLNYLAKKSTLSGIPVEIDDGTNILTLNIDSPMLEDAIISLSEPLSPPSTDVFDNKPAISMYISGPTNDPVNPAVGNYWLHTDSLPFKGGITEEYYYLHQNLTTDGNAPVQNEGTLSYVADPNNPVSTIGGNNMIVSVPDDSRKSQGSFDLKNPDFNTLTMDRDDVLGFISAPLSDTATFVGFPKAKIYAKGKTSTYATSKTNFDIMVRVIDVYPDGKEMFITEGTVNAKAREYAKSISIADTNDNTVLTNIDNDSYYYFQFDLLPLGHTFGEGHQIKFLLSSSNYPKYQSNPHIPTNDGEFFRWSPGDNKTYEYNGQTMAPQEAEITFDFNTDMPNYIMLPQLNSSFYAGINEEKKIEPQMNIYPNPAKDVIIVAWDIPVKGSIYIYDLTGELLDSYTVSENQNKHQLDISRYAAGIYFVTIPELGLSRKMIVE